MAGQPQAGPSTNQPSQASAWGKPAQSGPLVSQPPQAGGAWGKPAQATSKATAAPAGQPSTAWAKPTEKPVQADPTKPPTNQGSFRKQYFEYSNQTNQMKMEKSINYTIIIFFYILVQTKNVN